MSACLFCDLDTEPDIAFPVDDDCPTCGSSMFESLGVESAPSAGMSGAPSSCRLLSDEAATSSPGRNAMEHSPAGVLFIDTFAHTSIGSVLPCPNNIGQG